ncbi:MAG: HAD-IIIA family hydrolase [Candidatus Staskawiczbacteria bacterium]|nr:HAD-IIIA family hydrolase [Candidatus Staskawiczbacteria bacterium]
MKAVIAAGGKGTRLALVSKNIPKALVKIGNKPVIEHQILLLKKYGIKEVWILLGYLGFKIKDYLGDGRKFDVKIHYSENENPLGRTGDLKKIASLLKDDFLFLSGDIMMDFDIKRFIRFHQQKKDSIVAMVVHPSDHPFDSDLVKIDENNKVVSLLLKPHQESLFFQNLGIASVFIFSPKVLKYIPQNLKTDFEKDILPKILKAKKAVYAYKTPEYIKDMGTPERLIKVNKDYNLGKIKRLNFQNKRRAIFLDRDGTINKYDGEISKESDMNLYGFAATSVNKINNSDYLAIVITNQPGIAKGFITKKELDNIHHKLESDLGKNGAKVDEIYYCPHHPEKGFDGEVKNLKIKCNCRKPAIGLIKKAVKDFNIDIKKSFFIGDSTADARAAEKAGLKFIGVKTGRGVKDDIHKIAKKFIIKENLLEAVNYIIK